MSPRNMTSSLLPQGEVNEDYPARTLVANALYLRPTSSRRERQRTVAPTKTPISEEKRITADSSPSLRSREFDTDETPSSRFN